MQFIALDIINELKNAQKLNNLPGPEIPISDQNNDITPYPNFAIKHDKNNTPGITPDPKFIEYNVNPNNHEGINDGLIGDEESTSLVARFINSISIILRYFGFELNWNDIAYLLMQAFYNKSGNLLLNIMSNLIGLPLDWRYDPTSLSPDLNNVINFILQMANYYEWFENILGRLNIIFFRTNLETYQMENNNPRNRLANFRLGPDTRPLNPHTNINLIDNKTPPENPEDIEIEEEPIQEIPAELEIKNENIQINEIIEQELKNENNLLESENEIIEEPNLENEIFSENEIPQEKEIKKSIQSENNNNIINFENPNNPRSPANYEENKKRKFHFDIRTFFKPKPKGQNETNNNILRIKLIPKIKTATKKLIPVKTATKKLIPIKLTTRKILKLKKIKFRKKPDNLLNATEPIVNGTLNQTINDNTNTPYTNWLYDFMTNLLNKNIYNETEDNLLSPIEGLKPIKSFLYKSYLYMKNNMKNVPNLFSKYLNDTKYANIPLRVILNTLIEEASKGKQIFYGNLLNTFNDIYNFETTIGNRTYDEFKFFDKIKTLMNWFDEHDWKEFTEFTIEEGKYIQENKTQRNLLMPWKKTNITHWVYVRENKTYTNYIGKIVVGTIGLIIKTIGASVLIVDEILNKSIEIFCNFYNIDFEGNKYFLLATMLISLGLINYPIYKFKYNNYRLNKEIIKKGIINFAIGRTVIQQLNKNSLFSRQLNNMNNFFIKYFNEKNVTEYINKTNPIK